MWTIPHVCSSGSRVKSYSVTAVQSTYMWGSDPACCLQEVQFSVVGAWSRLTEGGVQVEVEALVKQWDEPAPPQITWDRGWARWVSEGKPEPRWPAPSRSLDRWSQSDRRASAGSAAHLEHNHTDRSSGRFTISASVNMNTSLWLSAAESQEAQQGAQSPSV